jgi:dTDP-4-amino-4,6-dideoxygalactose transaminase
MIKLFNTHMPKSVFDPLKETLYSGYLGQGQKVKEFEKKLGNYFNNEKVLTLNSCTSALHLALKLSDVKYGDEVISTPMTSQATNVSIVNMGAKIVWADIDPHTGNICPDSILQKITKKTSAIIIVDFGGYPCDLNEINDIGKKYGIKVIEDAAHSFGAEYDSKKIGNHSDFVCFSLQAIKHITTGDGGLLLCKNRDDYDRGKLLRWYGLDRSEGAKDIRIFSDIKECGYKFHMNDICATIGIEQLNYVEEILKKHRNNAFYYDEEISSSNIKSLIYKNDRISSYWLYILMVNNLNKFVLKMKEKKIMVSQVHKRNDIYTAFRDFRCELPGVDEFSSKMICIPVGWWITEEKREYIVKCINLE